MENCNQKQAFCNCKQPTVLVINCFELFYIQETIPQNLMMHSWKANMFFPLREIVVEYCCWIASQTLFARDFLAFHHHNNIENFEFICSQHISAPQKIVNREDTHWSCNVIQVWMHCITSRHTTYTVLAVYVNTPPALLWAQLMPVWKYGLLQHLAFIILKRKKERSSFCVTVHSLRGQ